MKVLQENIGSKIADIPHSNIFADISPSTREIKERINKWDYTNLRSFCLAKENINKMKREPTIWFRKIYLPIIPQTGVGSLKYIKNS